MKNTIYSICLLALFNACTPMPTGIAQIEFSTSPCFGTCPVFSMHIDSSRNATYHAIDNNERQGKFQGVIRKQDYDSLVNLILTGRIDQCQDTYRADVTDLAGCNLTITYIDGRIKKIDDYGFRAPEKLITIYARLIHFRNNQEWVSQ